MITSILNLFKIGIGPSSSHTVAPMVAANRFVLYLSQHNLLPNTHSIQIHLFGSLALTGKGHRTDVAIICGLAGKNPQDVLPQEIEPIFLDATNNFSLFLNQQHFISFDYNKHIHWHYDTFLPEHPNALSLVALDKNLETLYENTFFSIGGGFVLSKQQFDSNNTDNNSPNSNVKLPFPFSSAKELLHISQSNNLPIYDIVKQNELAIHDEHVLNQSILNIWNTMENSIQNGLNNTGNLPGSLNLPRRAPGISHKLKNNTLPNDDDSLVVMDWISLFALAVSEENGSGGKVVTAPTNGAAGIIPAVIMYYKTFVPNSNLDGIFKILLTATAIGFLFKRNASLSAAEVGCQGEVGVACAMAAAGLAAALNASSTQIENAAEIAIEHNLGLTCDPVNGLVQIPCIERNTFGAIKAVNAARLALYGDGSHFVPLDTAIKTMLQTGHDMKSKYKETSLGGLALNFPIC